MKELVQSLSSLGFSKAGDVVLDTKRGPHFALAMEPVGHGWVYIWLEMSESAARVVYIGKAGKTLHERCRQHVGGFRGGSTTGSAHAVRICAGIASGKRYELWSRRAAVVMLFGEHDISLADVEEKAFIQKFRPAWNKC